MTSDLSAFCPYREVTLKFQQCSFVVRKNVARVKELFERKFKVLFRTDQMLAEVCELYPGSTMDDEGTNH